jgi:hypothetical protein
VQSLHSHRRQLSLKYSSVLPLLDVEKSLIDKRLDRPKGIWCSFGRWTRTGPTLPKQPVKKPSTRPRNQKAKTTRWKTNSVARNSRSLPAAPCSTPGDSHKTPSTRAKACPTHANHVKTRLSMQTESTQLHSMQRGGHLTHPLRAPSCTVYTPTRAPHPATTRQH